MTRWQPDSRGRLQEAAMELYGERGYDQTTVAEIAERAGLTERTFFRHFADKREVLFAGSQNLQDVLVGAVAEAPDTAAPVEVVATGLDAVAALFDDRRDYSRRRHAIIAANPELQERELIKLSSLADVLRRRGVAEASLVAEVGIAVFKIAFGRWVDDANEQDLPELMRESLDAIVDLSAVRSSSHHDDERSRR